jgi:GntR family histidine utilization transcriptional repressor
MPREEADPKTSERDAPSLHRRIVDEVTANIVSGRWPPGHRVPNETELADGYGCSRMTVNKALSQLARGGLIERRRRSGSFVRAPRSQSAVLEIQDIRAEVEALGLAYGYVQMVRRRERDLLVLECLHLAGGHPFCHERRHIHLDTVPEAATHSFETQAPGPWLVAKVPWTQAEHRIFAVAADAPAAKALDVPPGAPCLVVERRTWSAERPVTMVRLTYPAERHMLVARFSPDPK